MAMKITVGIHNGASRSKYVPLMFSPRIVKTNHINTFNEKTTQVAHVINGRIVCRQIVSFVEALFYSRLKFIKKSKYFLVHMSGNRRLWPCACRIHISSNDNICIETDVKTLFLNTLSDCKICGPYKTARMKYHMYCERAHIL